MNGRRVRNTQKKKRIRQMSSDSLTRVLEEGDVVVNGTGRGGGADGRRTMGATRRIQITAPRGHVMTSYWSPSLQADVIVLTRPGVT